MIVKLYFLILLFSPVHLTIWSREHGCPISCTCREEHFSDLAISRYIRHEQHNNDSLSTDYEISNDVFDDNENFQYDDENPLLRVATCFLQAEANVEAYISNIPKNVQVLSFVNSVNSGNKTLRTSYFEHFDELIALEIQGSDAVSQIPVQDELVLEIDAPMLSAKYLNFDQVRLKNSKNSEARFQNKDNDEDIEIQFDSVTMIQKKDDSEILPYYKYKEIQKNLEIPIFTDFSNLILIRIHACNLQNIHWEMFDKLQSLKYLILQNNNIKFIPSFAFYGTPNLNTLSLAWNNLLNIQIADLAGLLELEYLDLSHNNFSQLSELSFPPFPKLKVADFRDNPITIVFPNTFEVMNTTDSIILGAEESRLQLMPNSFLGLNKLIQLTINNVDIEIFKQELLVGMTILKELIMTGNIKKIQYDAFMEVRQLEKLILNNCNIYNISMDSFYGLQNLQVLDLSRNHLTYLPPNIFDDQLQLKELLLSGNKFTELPKGIFHKIPARLIRLNENPWHCSCALSDWDPMIINKIKQRIFLPCDSQYDKGFSCTNEKKYGYVYENRVAPKCNTPNKLKNYSVFQAIRRQLHCATHKLKLKKIRKNLNMTITTTSAPLKIKKIVFEKDYIDDTTNQLNTNQQKNIINPLDTHLIKNIKIRKNHEPNDLILNKNSQKFNMYFSNTNNNNEMINKNNIYLKKKKQHLQTIAKMKKLKKEQQFSADIQHKEM